MTSKPRRVLMSNVDKAWLEMDTATNLMIINGIMLFDAELDFDELKQVLEERFVRKYARFRQRVVSGPGGKLYWEDDPHFDIRAHVRRYALPEPADIATLQTLVSAIINEPLDRRKPLWRYLYIEKVDGGSAIIARLHHSIADGMALVKVLLDMTGVTPEASLHVLQPTPAEPPHAPRSPAVGLLGLATGAVTASYHLARAVASETVQTLENPRHPLEVARSAGIISAASAAILAKLLILPPDRRSVFKGELGAIKRVLWSPPVELVRVKEIGKRLDATINDILVAAVAGALRRYMLEHGDDPALGDIYTTVPVNLRAPENNELGNQFGLVFLSLPVSLADPMDRLVATKRHMDVLKNSPEAFLVCQILGVIGTLPLDLAKQATAWFSTKASAVLTNVPGPRQQIYFAGKPLKNLMFWVPQTGEVGLGISIISYNGQVTLGIMLDEHLVARPELIMEGFEEELMLLEARMIAAETEFPGSVAHNGSNGAGVALSGAVLPEDGIHPA